jgi:putative transposase
MIQAVETLVPTLGIVTACESVGLPRGSYYRAQVPIGPILPRPVGERLPSVRALTPTEKMTVRDMLNSERFQDQAPREIYATLLDEERYLCSWRTMYRVLAENQPVRERRNQLRHPAYAKPELLATRPNQLWSWDITKLRGPATWTSYSLYVILDVFSRCVVGWLIAEHESEHLAQELLRETYTKQGIEPGQLTLHADNGSAMVSKSVSQLLIDLDVVQSHSRPHVSDDNPYSEAQFKTLKYRPDYPERFGCLADARAWAHAFFTWYNQAHHHTSLGLLTPAVVHAGQAECVRERRQRVLQVAYGAHPERFVKGTPKPAALPAAVWINPPKPAVQMPAILQ